jgi:hypothetical protein
MRGGVSAISRGLKTLAKGSLANARFWGSPRKVASSGWYNFRPASFGRGGEADRSRYREQVQGLMRSGKIQSAKDYYYAAFIFQHGQKPSDYLYAHVLAVTAVSKGLHAAIWLSAATLDRYLESIQRPQVFGTQYGVDSRDDQEPYDRRMLSDTIRAL